VTSSLSGRITRVLNWHAEAMSRYQLRCCGWASPAGASRGWQRAPGMARVLRDQETALSGSAAAVTGRAAYPRGRLARVR
jgi:hypothetical protein